MKSQLSHVGKGLTLTLLMLGFSHKGMYGEVPVVFKDLPSHLNKVSQAPNLNPASKQINSLFVRGTSLIILVEHNHALTRSLQAETNSARVPLFISVSTLPASQVEFKPLAFAFEQQGTSWQPGAEDITPRRAGSRFGGTLADDELHEGVILLPPWIDVQKPIRVTYLKSETLMRF